MLTPPTRTVGARHHPIRVVVADDGEVYRRGLQSLIEAEEDIAVVGQATSAAEAVQETTLARPDVVILGETMRGQCLLDACAALRASSPSTKVLFLTASQDPVDLARALKVGAQGYLVKTLPGEQIMSSIRSAHAGHIVIPPPMTGHLLDTFVPPTDLDLDLEATGPGRRRLTAREVEVLGMVADGLSNREIATTLDRSENTVKIHVRHLMRKMQARSRWEAAIRAVRENLIEPPPG